MRTLTLEAFQAVLRAQGVRHPADLAFRCPVCGTVQTGRDLIAAGAGPDWEAVRGFIGFSCIGRWAGAGPYREGGPVQQGCDWTLGGLLHLHTLEVLLPDGSRRMTFEPVNLGAAGDGDQDDGGDDAGD